MAKSENRRKKQDIACDYPRDHRGMQISEQHSWCLRKDGVGNLHVQRCINLDWEWQSRISAHSHSRFLSQWLGPHNRALQHCDDETVNFEHTLFVVVQVICSGMRRSAPAFTQRMKAKAQWTRNCCAPNPRMEILCRVPPKFLIRRIKSFQTLSSKK